LSKNGAQALSLLLQRALVSPSPQNDYFDEMTLMGMDPPAGP
jgi:hypothetical protein